MKNILILFTLPIISMSSCKKGVQISQPINLITSKKVFTNKQAATSAILGIYSQMMNSKFSFASGAMSIYPGLSADEIYSTFPDPNYDPFSDNDLLSSNRIISNNIWRWAYIFIYQSNACIEGLSNSTEITQDTKEQLIGEAEFIRAFCHFYLVNLFGAVPVVKSTDYKVNELVPRSDEKEVYEQITTDLVDAVSKLSNNYVYSSDNTLTSERTRPNKWTAAALLARVYLYMGDWKNAELQATSVIESRMYKLEPDLSRVFLRNSQEAIWQLHPVIPHYGNNTFEGLIFIPFDSATIPVFNVNNYLLKAFEPGDERKDAWIGKNTINGEHYYYPNKYKVINNAPEAPLEYSVVLRLAEQYLIRAEARAQLNNIQGSRDDLDVIRIRAGLPNTNANSTTSLLSAIEDERRIEFCFEWGHRWLDLKRTSRINEVMSKEKSGWQPSAALYPIPFSEIKTNPRLTQNDGY